MAMFLVVRLEEDRQGLLGRWLVGYCGGTYFVARERDGRWYDVPESWEMTAAISRAIMLLNQSGIVLNQQWTNRVPIHLLIHSMSGEIENITAGVAILSISHDMEGDSEMTG
jgi:hypothetical protein